MRDVWYGALAGVILVLLLIAVMCWVGREHATHIIDSSWSREPGVKLHVVHICTSRERATLIHEHLHEAMPCTNDRDFMGVSRLHLMLHSFGYDNWQCGNPANDVRLTINFVEEPDDRLVGKYPYYYFEWLVDDFPIPPAP